MEYCHSTGIAHSEFLSWSEHDQEAEIAYMLNKHSRCPGCGTFPEEWLDEEGKVQEPVPYVVKTAACLGCEAIAEAKERIPSNRRDQIQVYLVPNEEAQHRGRLGKYWSSGSPSG